MANASAFAIFIVVLSPLLLPLTISAVHAVAKVLRNLRDALGSTGPQSRAVTPDRF
jgi:hypothetical protein